MLRILLNNSPVGMLIADAVRDANDQLIDFRYTAFNDKIISITGLDSGLQLEDQLMSKVSPHYFQEGGYFHQFKQVLDSGRPTTFETFYQNRRGQSGWYQVTLSPQDDSITIVAVNITATKEAEQRLRAQTQLLAGVLNSSPAAILAFDPIRNDAGEVYDFRITLANQAAVDESPRQLVAVSDPNWLIGRTVLELHPQSRVLPYMLEVIRTGRSQRVVHDYSEFDQVFDFSIVANGDGVVTTTADITALYRQKKLLQTILDSSPTGVVLYEAIRDERTGAITDFRYRLTNATNLTLTGLTSEQMVGQTMLTLFPDTKDTDLWHTVVRVTETGQSQRLTFPYDKYGINGWFDGYFVREGDGVLFTYVDITPVKQAELEREQQADRVERILDRIPAAVFVSEAVYADSAPKQIIDFIIRDVNVLGAEPYGLSRAQMIGRRASELFPNDRENGVFDRYVEVLQTQQPQQFDFDYGGSERRWVDVRLVPFDISSVVATTLDITPIKQAQLTLEAMNDELRRSNDNLQRFAYVASHDLQEPLRKVQSFGDLLANQHAGQLGPDGLDFVRRMQASAARMSTLIRDLLTYSRLATRQDAHAPHSLGDIVAEVLDDLALTVQESAAQVYVEDLPTLTGDRGQLSQLFQNLIGNALKFRRPAQPPVISITHRRIKASDLPADGMPLVKNGAYYWEICVTDNGIGFAEKYTERIFQVFQRLHTKSQYAGTGIGLAICQKVAENHNGLIRASSRPDEGATFRVYLPV